MPTTFSDPAFADVVQGSLLSNACSPEIEGGDFRGLRIAAPEVVTYAPGDFDPITGAFARVIVCGTYRLDFTTLGLNGDFVESIVLIAVDEARRETFSGRMVTVENRIPPPDFGDGLEPADFAGDVITGYFNPNLAVVLGLPERPADYVVYAVLGPYESNRVRLSVREAAVTP